MEKSERTLASLKTMKMCVGILKMVLKRSSAVIWFEYVYVLDVPEDPEDFLIFVYFFDIII